MSSRRATPNTPFIPPLGSPNISPHPSPNGGQGGGSPNWSVHPSMAGGYPVYPAASPYVNTTPFVPQISPMLSPGVIPNLPPQQQSQRPAHSSRVSDDYTGYPPGGPPMFSPMVSAGPHPSPMMPPSVNPYGHWPGYHPASAPPTYSGFATPWSQPGIALPPTATPWGVPHGLPPQTYTPYGHAAQTLPPVGPQASTGWPGMQPAYSGDQWLTNRPAARPEPPATLNDKVDKFAEGLHYGPVLEPFLVKVVRANLKINPLIQVYDENSGDDSAHLMWNMLYPTSTVQRSTDPTHVSWFKGRDEPATFPRVSSLRVVSEITPWVIEVQARERERGVTCGDVIDAIGYDFNKRTQKEDFQIYSGPEQRELTNAYHWNRSRNSGAPGGQLGNGMKRLDFLRSRTMFGGLELNERTVKQICGEVLPATFVVKCVPAMAASQREQQERELRMRAGGRSRVNSTNTRITVEGPSSIDDDDDSE